jgi:hypothetical protein
MARLDGDRRRKARALAGWTIAALFAVIVVASFAIFIMAPAAKGPEPVLLVPHWTLLDAKGGVTRELDLPAHVDDDVEKDSVYRLKAQIAVPPEFQGQSLTFSIPRLQAYTELVAEGQSMLRLTAVQADSYRVSGPHRWRIPANLTAGSSLTLVVSVRHRWSQSGWLDVVPRISATPAGDAMERSQETFNSLTASAALNTSIGCAFVYGILFLFDRRQRAHGWFALEAIGGAFSPLFELGLSEQLFGTADAPLLVLMLNLAMVASVYFSYGQFRTTQPPRYVMPIFTVVAVACMVVGGRYEMTRLLAPVSVIAVTLNIVYQVRLAVDALRQEKQRVRASSLLVSWVVLGVSAIPDFFSWSGFGELLGGTHTAAVGIWFISVLQAALLSWDHAMTLARADRLNRQLQERVRELEERKREADDRRQEVDVLNDELRRQMASRSEQLAGALSRLAQQAHRALLLEPGVRVDGRYEVVRELGSGAMGAVYEVVRLVDGMRFAMKVLASAGNNLELARFAREAQIFATLHHPNVVGIVDVEVSGDGQFYLVTELVEGDPLRNLRHRFGEQRWAIEILGQVAEGLLAIHRAGVVHRDLKPGNILVDEREGRPIVKIADFGISSIRSEESDQGWTRSKTPRHEAMETPTVVESRSSTPNPVSDLTATGMLMGTPRYMAPELVDGAKYAMPSSDVFSFGVLAYELLCGDMPYLEPPAQARLDGRHLTAPVSLRTKCPGLDPRVAQLLDDAASLEPHVRPTVAELVGVLRRGSISTRASA